MKVVRRRRNLYTSTFTSEVVQCRLGGGEELAVFCKYGDAATQRGSYGHRGGVPYEVAVYREVLVPLNAHTPAFYGAYEDRDTGTTWLVLEYIDGATRVKYSDMTVHGLAAEKIGRFHAAAERYLRRRPLSFLERRNAAYYTAWAQRTAQFAGRLDNRFRWLPTLCRAFEQVAPELSDSGATVVHGEHYGSNVLYRGSEVFALDWESASIGQGAIDLASLTDGWPPEYTDEAESRYKAARWPHGAPSSFERQLDIARLYLAFLWLGMRPDWTSHRKARRYFSEAQRLGEGLGLI